MRSFRFLVMAGAIAGCAAPSTPYTPEKVVDVSQQQQPAATPAPVVLGTARPLTPSPVPFAPYHPASPDVSAAPTAAGYGPAGVAVNAAGDLFYIFRDRVMQRKADGTTRMVFGPTLAEALTDGRLHWPQGLALDSAGNLYVAALPGIYKVAPDGTRSTTYADLPFFSVLGRQSYSIAVDGQDHLFFEVGQDVYRVDSPTAATLLAKDTEAMVFGAQQDGTLLLASGQGLTLARLFPDGSVVPVKQSVQAYAAADNGDVASVATRGNDAYVLLGTQLNRIGPDDAITHLGTGSGPLGRPSGLQGLGSRIAVRPDGEVVVADEVNGVIDLKSQDPDEPAHTLLAPTPIPVPRPPAGLDYGQVTGLAGTPDGKLALVCGNAVYLADATGVRLLAGSATAGQADGAGAAASFAVPAGVAWGDDGALYVADQAAIRRVGLDGAVTTVASMVPIPDNPMPTQLAIASQNTYYYLNAYGLRRVNPDGTQTTLMSVQQNLALYDQDHHAVSIQIGGMACDAAGNLYLSDRQHLDVVKVTPDGTATTFAGAWPETYPQGYGGKDGPPGTGTFIQPGALVADPAGGLLIMDNDTAPKLRRIGLDGAITTVDQSLYQGSALALAGRDVYRSSNGLPNLQVLHLP